MKFNTFQDFINNYYNSDIDRLDYWDELKKVNPNKEYFNEPNWKDLSLQDISYVVSKIHYLFPKACQKWIFDKKYILKDPYFPQGIKNNKLRILLMIESPVEFKSRNIYISNNALRRV